MKVFQGTSVNEIYALAMREFALGEGVTRKDSRNGPVLEFDTPVASVYRNPVNRVLFNAARDCNPFLHLFESLWMLAGRNDLSFLTPFTKNMAQFSDDGETLHGAYGHRWRQHFDRDQLAEVIEHLRKYPDSRRAVLQMWDPRTDLNRDGRDVPCNTAVFFLRRGNDLDMTVTNRSNDAVWGAYGANAVHMSVLHEYVAAATGMGVGRYTQFSNSLHIYPELPVVKRVMSNLPDPAAYCEYDLGLVRAEPLLQKNETPWQFDHDLLSLGSEMQKERLVTKFFRWTVHPMMSAHNRYKEGDKAAAAAAAASIHATDWRKATLEWIARRHKA